MSRPDITLAVTAHSESVVAGPSLHGAANAVRCAEAAGFRVEVLVGMDTPSDECRAFFRQQTFGNCKTVEFQMADPYPARNALVAMAAGRWLAFLDADDLFSENWLVNAAKRLADAERASERVVVHPEINWVFDGLASVYAKTPQSDAQYVPHHFYFANYYDMLCMAPRQVHLDIPYVRRDLVTGYGYGDWQWNIESMAAGWRHVIAKDTIIFKRRRDKSVVVENIAREAVIHDVEPMAIDRVLGLGRNSTLTSTFGRHQ